MFEKCGRTTDDDGRRQTPDNGYTISSPCEPEGSGELKKKHSVQIGKLVSEKILFEFLYVNDLGPRSRNNLDRQYSHTFIYSIRCQLLLTFRSLAAIVSEKSTVFTFSYRKACYRI